MTALAASKGVQVRSRRRPSFSVARLLVLGIVLVPFLYPLLYLLSTAVKARRQFVDSPNNLLPTSLDFSHLGDAWARGALGGAMANSAIAVAVGVLIVVTVSAPAAFWFYANEGRVSRFTRGALIATMSFPLIAMIIPLFVILNALNVIDNLVVLGLLYGTVNIPFGVFLMHAYLKTGLPAHILEAASVDGAGSWSTFRHIVIPLARPALATLSALTFVWTWGDLLLAVVLLQDPAKQTAMVAVSNLNGQRDALDVQLNAAAALIALLPVLPIFLLAQRALARGFALSSDK